LDFLPVPLAALSSSHKLGLALVAAAFIVFALVSALLIPRFRPEFPGRRRNAFLAVTVLIFLGMMTAVVIFGRESEESEASGSNAEKTATSGTQPSPPPAAPSGNPAAGKAVFTANGCASCHTFTPAGATGTIGPDLSKVLKGKAAAFIRQSVVDPNAVIAAGYQPNIMPQDFGQKLSAKQLNDLIAFLQQ
jgi:mono/diheme cytochrome c family protein